MENEASITWISSATTRKMMGVLGISCTAKYNRQNIRVRLIFIGRIRKLECCLEDVKQYLKNGGMQLIVDRLSNENKRRSAPTGKMPPDPINSKAAASILDTHQNRVYTHANSGRLTLYRKAPKSGYFYSEQEVRKLRCDIDDYKEDYVQKSDKLARERQEDWRKINTYTIAKRNRMRVELGNLRPSERGVSYMATARQAAFLLNVTPSKIDSFRRSGVLKSHQETPCSGGRAQYHYLKSDVLAIWHNPEHSKCRAKWNTTNNPRNWQEETRRRLMGDKVEPFVSAESKRKEQETPPEVARRAHFERPEWMYSQSRDWTAYTYEVEARIKRTIKPQW